jgi:hypothetical protein
MTDHPVVPNYGGTPVCAVFTDKHSVITIWKGRTVPAIGHPRL